MFGGGEGGYASASIRAVCEAASLNSRYFYESFSSREDLLYAVYRGIIYEIASASAQATAQARTIEDKARAGLRAGWTLLTEDPRKARIIAVEVVGVSDRLERLRRDNRHRFADELFAELLVKSSPGKRSGGGQAFDPVLAARGLMGAVVEVLADWINGEVDASVEEIIEHFTWLFAAIARAGVRADTSVRTPRARVARKDGS